MGVLACDRSGCENIMCDLVSSDFGYICEECYEELLHKPNISIEWFMLTPRDYYEADKEIENLIQESQEDARYILSLENDLCNLKEKLRYLEGKLED